MNFTNPSDNVLQVTNYGLTRISTGSDLSLSWPSIYSDNTNAINSCVDIETTNSNLVISLPNAMLGSVGYTFIVVNVGGMDFSIHDADGNNIASFPSSSSNILYLRDNSSTSGTWGILPLATGFNAISSIGAIQPDSGFTITGSPITSTGDFVFELTGMLLALENIDGNGILVKSGPSSIITKSIEGDDNIIVTNGSGIDSGSISITLNNDLTGINSAGIGSLLLSNNSITSLGGNINFDSNISLSDGLGIVFYNGTNTTTILGGSPASNITFYLPNSKPSENGQIMLGNIDGNFYFSNLIGEAATNEQMMNANDSKNIAVASNIRFSPSCYKALAYCTIDSGIITTVSSYFMATVPVVRNSEGDYTATLSEDLTDANFIINSSSSLTAAGNPTLINCQPISSSQFSINVKDAQTLLLADPVSFSVSVLSKSVI